MEKLQLFLTSPDIESIVRQIYANKITPQTQVILINVPVIENEKQITKKKAIEKKINNIDIIRAEFLACLSLYLSEDQKTLKGFADQLFDALLEGCEIALDEAINKGQLYAHEAKSSLRHYMLADELETIKKNLNFINSSHKPSIREILEFEKKYLQQVANRHGYIIPTYFDVAKKVPIENIFVNPSFLSQHSKYVFNMNEFLSVIYRAVVLGNPGAGKSTFAFKLCHDLATYHDKRIFSGRQVTPILVVLRDYGAHKKNNNSSILEFIETTSNSKYQVKPPSGAFEYLLLNGRTVIIFDGIDELIETRYRQEISSDIESFCTLYPSVPVIVTSREVGYDQAPLNDKFETFRLNPFNDDQVREYVTKWFAEDLDLMQEQHDQKEIAFLRESQIVPDLRSNPLMLALMCNIYRGENYIPKNRPDIYEKCSLMLFERWDKSRGINFPHPFEAHIKPTMMYLANWIFSNARLEEGVTENNLIEKTIEYLCPRRFEDRSEAEKAAVEFIEFCRGRAWVFTDIGTTKEGEKLYQFTHRTFLEYFTAAYLVRTHATPFSLISFLIPKIVSKEWDVVAQLAFQLQSKNLEGAGDELLIVLIKQISKVESDEKWNVLSFVVRCLEFMVPSPKIIKHITTAWFEFNMVWYLENAKQKMASSEKIVLFKYGEFIGDFLYVSTDNRKTIADTLEKLILSRVNNGSELEAVLALQIGLYFTFISFNNKSEKSKLRLDNMVLDFWNRFSDSIFEACSKQILALSPKYFCLCNESFRMGKVSITNLVKWHGFKGLFSPCNKSLAPAEILMEFILSYPYLKDEQKYLNDLQEVSLILLSSPPEWWIRGQKTFSFSSLKQLPQVQTKNPKNLLNLNSDALFGAFALFAAMLENAEEIQRLEIITWIEANQNPFFDLIGLILKARFSKVEMDKIQEKMGFCGFTKEQHSFVWRWIRREINLVRY